MPGCCQSEYLGWATIYHFIDCVLFTNAPDEWWSPETRYLYNGKYNPTVAHNPLVADKNYF